MKPPGCLTKRCGYTLWELLIVVALLGTALMLAAPSLGRFSQRGQLLNAARELRAELLTARLSAIEAGDPTWFFYEPGGNTYSVTATQRSPRRGDSGANPMIDDTGELTADDVVPGDEQSLPPGIVFLEASNGSQRLRAASLRSGPTVLVFYPNGRALNAQIPLALDDYRVELTVRGLTGTVQISRVRRVAESERGRDRGQPEPLTTVTVP